MEMPGVQHVASGAALDKLGLIHRVRIPEADGPHPTLVMLHGLQGTEDVTWIFARAAGPQCLIVTPRAPFQAQEGYRWSDLGPEAEGESELFGEGESRLKTFVQNLSSVYPVDPARILLLGFSQGAAMSYTLAASNPRAIIGVAGLSGFIPQHLAANLPEFEGLPILMLHGTEDATIPIAVARRNRDQLAAAGASVSYHESAVGHKISSSGMTELKQWIKERLEKPNR
jgi:phospholipase/carboxylesterase